MLRNLLLLSTLLILPMIAFAFDGDYVWEEKFNAQLVKAKQGDGTAQYAVGDMYTRGRGVGKDLTMAFEWFSRSAEQNNKKAAYKVGYAYLKGRGTFKDEEKAMEWLTVASNQGYERAHFYIAEMYEQGIGVEQNYDSALSWYIKAKEGGFNPAIERINRVNAAVKEANNSRVKKKRRNKMRAESTARKQISPKKIAKTQTVSIKSPPPTTKELILQGGWTKRNKPLEYMPSEITQCKITGSSIECLSNQQRRNIGLAEIHYTTKATLFGMEPEGTFKISYRNNVLKVDITDPEYADSGAKPPVRTGWQEAEHTLTCKMEDNNNLLCMKNKLRSIKISR